MQNNQSSSAAGGIGGASSSTLSSDFLSSVGLVGNSNSNSLSNGLGSVETSYIQISFVLESTSPPTYRSVVLPLPIPFTFDSFAALLSSEFQQPVNFQYQDEEGERITVKNDQDVNEMLSMYIWLQSNPSTTGMPLTLYVQLTRAPAKNKRNIFALKVETSTPSSSGKPMNKAIAENFSKVRIAHEELQAIENLGQGSSGSVYKMIHIPSGTPIAVKTIPIDLSAQDEKQIVNELEVLYKCDSPCIITFYGAYFRENRFHICMEFMDGGSLDALYGAVGPIPELVLGRIIVSVVDGLTYLYEHMKIMHRDVKPSNILVNTRGEIKLCDFGVSGKLMNSLANTFVGTNAYMAPERIVGASYSIRSDVWSLGLTIIELALGRFPYPSDNGVNPVRQLTPFELIECIVTDPVPRLSEEVFSPELINFVAHCMIKPHDLRPNPVELKGHTFYHKHSMENISIAPWIQSAIELMKTPRLSS